MPANSEGPTPRVSAKAVLSALSAVKRHGHWPLFQRMEHAEPELAEHVMEELSIVHQLLLESGGRPKVARRLQRQIQSIVLVTWLCLRPNPSDGRDLDSPYLSKEDP